MTGTVTDASTREPLAGAHVVHLGTDGTLLDGAATDADGRYTYEWDGAGPIAVRVSFVGYEPLYTMVNPAGVVNFELVPVVYDLGEGAEVFGDAPGGPNWGLLGLGVLVLLALASED